jgi:hypothetical protein
MLFASPVAWSQTQVNQTLLSQGPSPSQGPLETVQSGENIPNGTVTGAVGTIVSDPTNNTIYLGSPNGGVFVSHNNGATWSALTDNQASLSISSNGGHQHHEQQNIRHGGRRQLSFYA